MNEIDRSNEALLVRRALAEKATPGPWKSRVEGQKAIYEEYDIWSLVYGPERVAIVKEGGHMAGNAAHIAANSPEVVMADIDEIMRLRANLAATECRDSEGDAYVEQLCLERDDLEAQVERLEKEADWLAARCHEFCKSYGYCGECPMFSGCLKREHEDCGATVGYRGEKHTANWREAARNAVEESCH